MSPQLKVFLREILTDILKKNKLLISQELCLFSKSSHNPTNLLLSPTEYYSGSMGGQDGTD
jgi:hypothetical protein